MRKIREILRLKSEKGMSGRQIARSVGVGRKAVQDCLGRAAAAGVSWPLSADEDDEALEKRLYPVVEAQAAQLPDWEKTHVDLKGKGVTLRLLWQEHRQSCPGGPGYSHFCDLYRDWRKQRGLVMHQEYKAGEVLFVDYAGMTMPIQDRETGAVVQVPVFVGILGASQHIFTEVTPDAKSPHWLGSHIRCFEDIGGVPEVVVCDNLKTGVSKPCRYDPEINPQYAALMRHYGCVVVPARARHPRDKALVENAVLLVERWVLAPLRNQTFFSCGEINEAMRDRNRTLNNAPLTGRGISRHELLMTVERPALRPLPPEQFVVWSMWVEARVNLDYHVQFAKSYYSVPYHLKHKRVEVRATATSVEILHKGARVAIHCLACKPGVYVTCAEHMPAHHRQYRDRSTETLLAHLGQIGPFCAQWATALFQARSHVELGYRACLGIYRLAHRYPPARVEASCKRALYYGLLSYRGVADILAKGLDKQPLPPSTALPGVCVNHENVRGSTYYGPQAAN